MIFIIDSLAEIWGISGSKNNYACLSDLVGKYGVYIFQDDPNECILYVGEAHKQDLKTRVKQNLTEKDSGGTFRENYMKAEKVNFDNFKNFIGDKKIMVITVAENSLIRPLESLLICALKPKYNKNQ